jgi:hypothetical protein
VADAPNLFPSRVPFTVPGPGSTGLLTREALRSLTDLRTRLLELVTNEALMAAISDFVTEGQMVDYVDDAIAASGGGGGGGATLLLEAGISGPRVTSAPGAEQGALVMDTAATNVGACYDTATGIFTAPATGLYLISALVPLELSQFFAQAIRLTLDIAGVERLVLTSLDGNGSAEQQAVAVEFSQPFAMTAGDAAALGWSVPPTTGNPNSVTMGRVVGVDYPTRLTVVRLA